MKKLILIAALLMISVSAAFAQPSYGVKLGLNGANVSKMDGDMKFSLYGGVFAEWKLGNVVAISPELIYSRQGSQEKFDGDKYRARLNYLNLPVMVKLYLTMDNSLSLDLGPQFGYLLNAKAWAKEDGNTATGDMEGMNDFDVSFGAGLTYNFGKVFAQGRYNIGLTNAFKGGDGERNGVIQIGLGYRF